MLQRKGDAITRVVENTSQKELTPKILEFVKEIILYYIQMNG